MKTPYVIACVAAAVLVTITVEETRIAALRRDAERPLAPAATPAPPAGTSSRIAGESGPGTPPRASERRDPKPVAPANPGDESLAKTARKMWDNPAGRSMMTQGVKIAVAMMYDDFINGLGLSKEEAGYFRNLLGNGLAAQQELGMKMMGATAEERKTLAEDLKQAGLENDEAIRKFLNDDEDYKSYTTYKDRLPERQQLAGIRATMESKGAPIDAATETRLVEAMYNARTTAQSPDLTGPEAIANIGKGNLAETFEKTWQAQQNALRTSTADFLNPAQQSAFEEYQRSMKDMQLMSLKMAEKMLNDGKSGSP